MKICAIQQPYPYTPEEAPAAVQFVIDELPFLCYNGKF